MKFLCVVCDEQMKLRRTIGPERGSVTLIYGCPTCGYAFAMMTNPHETQVVSSLGVKVGVGEGEEAEAAASKCPFTGMLQEMGEAPSDSVPAPSGEAGAEPESSAPRWTETARQRLQSIPESVRWMAESGIERYARDRGYSEIDERVLDEARRQFGM